MALGYRNQPKRKDQLMTSTTITDLERHDLVHALREHRNLLLRTVSGLTDAQFDAS